MKIKKILMTTAVIMCFATVTKANGVKFDNIQIDGGNVSVDVSYNGTETQTVSLICVYAESETGRILGIDTDTADFINGDELQLSTSLNYTGTESGYYKYYLWDNLSSHLPLENTPPAPPVEFSNTANYKDASISWEVADDDNKAVVKYHIYSSGMYLGETSETILNIDKLDRNETVDVQIVSEDSEGLKSLEGEHTFKTNEIPTSTLSNELTSNVSDADIMFINETSTSKYGYTENYQCEDGRSCRITTEQTVSGAARIGRIPFKFSDSYLDKIKDIHRFTVEIEYFDDEQKDIYVNYDGAGAALGRNAKICTTTGTYTWRKASIDITDAYFVKSENSGNSYANLRIHSNLAGLKLYKVSISPKDEYTINSASVKINDTYTDDKINFKTGSSSNGGIVELVSYNDEKCLRAENGGYFEFQTDKSYVSQNTRNIYIEYCYFDSINDSLIVEYNSAYTSEPNSQLAHSCENTGKWKKVRYQIDNAKFSGQLPSGQLSNADFRIYTQNGSPLLIKYVKVINPTK